MPDTDTVTVDFDARYQVQGMRGVAFRLTGWATEWTEERWELDCAEDHEHDEACYLYDEPQEVPRTDMVKAVMVGDDRVHFVDTDDLVLLDELDYCTECGQVGCTHDGREREES